jgi:hypothetical protein
LGQKDRMSFDVAVVGAIGDCIGKRDARQPNG